MKHAKVRPCLFMRDVAEEAARFYVEVVPDSRLENVVRPGPDAPAIAVELSIAGSPFLLLNGNQGFAPSHDFSISVLTEDQAETDRLWAALVDGGREGQCGWLVDRFGVHWQVVPEALPRLMGQGGAAAGRVQAAMMKMRKIDIAQLERAAAESAT